MNRDDISRSAIPIEFHRNRTLDDFKKFVTEYRNWIFSYSGEIGGLPPNHYITSGVTDAFNQTYALYNKIGIFDGEYGYHKIVLDQRVTHNLEEADVIIISHPFSADGNCSHEKIKEADQLGIPIFIDCAYLGICNPNISFDFSEYKNIKSVAFSLSKTFGTGLYRVGLLFTHDKYPCTIYRDWNYDLVASAEVHYGLLSNIGPNYMYEKYRTKQEEVCKQLDLIPSDTIIFGVDYTEKYRKKYKRGKVNRVCISNLIRDENIK